MNLQDIKTEENVDQLKRFEEIFRLINKGDKKEVRVCFGTTEQFQQVQNYLLYLLKEKVNNEKFYKYGLELIHCMKLSLILNLQDFFNEASQQNLTIDQQQFVDKVIVNSKKYLCSSPDLNNECAYLYHWQDLQDMYSQLYEDEQYCAYLKNLNESTIVLDEFDEKYLQFYKKWAEDQIELGASSQYQSLTLEQQISKKNLIMMQIKKYQELYSEIADYIDQNNLKIAEVDRELIIFFQQKIKKENQDLKTQNSKLYKLVSQGSKNKQLENIARTLSLVNDNIVQNLPQLTHQRSSLIQISYRTYFTINEHLFEDENEQIEYKNYHWPITDKDMGQKILKTICGFLNCKGGEIYLGITDNQNKVMGVSLTHKQQDEFMRFINMLCNHFDPPLNIQDREVQVFYIPIKDQSNNWIKGFWIPKIVVKQGKVLDKYYSFQYQDQFYVYIRIHNQCQQLKDLQLKNEIYQKAQSPSELFEWYSNCPPPDRQGVKACKLYDTKDYQQKNVIQPVQKCQKLELENPKLPVITKEQPQIFTTLSSNMPDKKSELVTQKQINPLLSQVPGQNNNEKVRTDELQNKSSGNSNDVEMENIPSKETRLDNQDIANKETQQINDICEKLKLKKMISQRNVEIIIRDINQNIMPDFKGYLENFFKNVNSTSIELSKDDSHIKILVSDKSFWLLKQQEFQDEIIRLNKKFNYKKLMINEEIKYPSLHQDNSLIIYLYDFARQKELRKQVIDIFSKHHINNSYYTFDLTIPFKFRNSQIQQEARDKLSYYYEKLKHDFGYNTKNKKKLQIRSPTKEIEVINLNKSKINEFKTYCQNLLKYEQFQFIPGDTQDVYILQFQEIVDCLVAYDRLLKNLIFKKSEDKNLASFLNDSNKLMIKFSNQKQQKAKKSIQISEDSDY